MSIEVAAFFNGGVHGSDGIESSILSSSSLLRDDMQSCWLLARARSECCMRRRNLKSFKIYKYELGYMHIGYAAYFLCVGYYEHVHVVIFMEFNKRTNKFIRLKDEMCF